MVLNCAVVSCKNRFKKGNGITFHRFPANKQLLTKWLRAIGREDYKPSDFVKICSAHFRDDDICIDKYNRRILRKNAVPSKFDCSKMKEIKKIITETVPEVANEIVINYEDTDITDSTTEDISELNNGECTKVSPYDQSHSNEFEENASKTASNNLDVCHKPISDQFLKLPSTAADDNPNRQIAFHSDTTSVILPTSIYEKYIEGSSVSDINQFDVSCRSDNVKNEVRRRNRANKRKRDFDTEDFEKISDTRLADPKVVKQLLTVAYKTIQEQREMIMSWRLKYKKMEQKVVHLHKVLRELKGGKCA